MGTPGSCLSRSGGKGSTRSRRPGGSGLPRRILFFDPWGQCVPSTRPFSEEVDDDFDIMPTEANVAVFMACALRFTRLLPSLPFPFPDVLPILTLGFPRVLVGSFAVLTLGLSDGLIILFFGLPPLFSRLALGVSFSGCGRRGGRSGPPQPQ